MSNPIVNADKSVTFSKEDAPRQVGNWIFDKKRPENECVPPAVKAMGGTHAISKVVWSKLRKSERDPNIRFGIGKASVADHIFNRLFAGKVFIENGGRLLPEFFYLARITAEENELRKRKTAEEVLGETLYVVVVKKGRGGTRIIGEIATREVYQYEEEIYLS